MNLYIYVHFQNNKLTELMNSTEWEGVKLQSLTDILRKKFENYVQKSES